VELTFLPCSAALFETYNLWYTSLYYFCTQEDSKRLQHYTVCGSEIPDDTTRSNGKCGNTFSQVATMDEGLRVMGTSSENGRQHEDVTALVRRNQHSKSWYMISSQRMLQAEYRKGGNLSVPGELEKWARTGDVAAGTQGLSMRKRSANGQQPEDVC